MRRYSQKLVNALWKVEELGIVAPVSSEDVYTTLNDHGFFWDYKSQRWVEDDRPPQLPSDDVIITIQAETRVLQEVLCQTRMGLAEAGYDFLGSDEPYRCRPPHQLVSKVRMGFRKNPTWQAEQGENSKLYASPPS